MSVAFYMDEHVPKPITLALRIRGVDVLTAQEDDRRATSRLKKGVKFAGLVFAHPARISLGECIRDIEMIAKAGEPKDLANQILYLPV